MLTLAGSAFPNNQQTIQFKVNNVINPSSALTTDFFNCAIYQLSGENYV